jgi:hypothetical protein
MLLVRALGSYPAIVHDQAYTTIAHGLGAQNAPAHKEQTAPGERNVASDSYTSNSGIAKGSSNMPGEKGNVGAIVGEKPNDHINQGNMK